MILNKIEHELFKKHIDGMNPFSSKFLYADCINGNFSYEMQRTFDNEYKIIVNCTHRAGYTVNVNLIDFQTAIRYISPNTSETYKMT